METLEQTSFLNSLMILPRKPEFIGFTMDTEELYGKMVEKLNEIMGEDLSAYCSADFSDDMEYLFYIDEYGLTEIENGDEILKSLPFDWDSPWETVSYLVKKVYGLEDTWVYVQGRYSDSTVIEIQIGIPQSL